VVPGDELAVTVLMLGGGPELRSTTFKIFHERSAGKVIREAGKWAAEVASKLGCTPMIPQIGIGRTHFEATSMMIEAMKEADFDHQSDWEQEVTDMVNHTGSGSLGLKGSVTALGCFIKVGPQRASGQRMVCMRPGCSVDIRRATVVLTAQDLREKG
jgi:fumarate hydratase subunit alpha